MTVSLTGSTIQRLYVDKRYRGHDVRNPRRVFIFGQKRSVFGIIQHELRGRSAIEPYASNVSRRWIGLFGMPAFEPGQVFFVHAEEIDQVFCQSCVDASIDARCFLKVWHVIRCCRVSGLMVRQFTRRGL